MTDVSTDLMRREIKRVVQQLLIDLIYKAASGIEPERMIGDAVGVIMAIIEENTETRQ